MRSGLRPSPTFVGAFSLLSSQSSFQPLSATYSLPQYTIRHAILLQSCTVLYYAILDVRAGFVDPGPRLFQLSESAIARMMRTE